MSQTIEFPANTQRGQKRAAFRQNFPDKASVEARVGAVIDTMSLNAGDKAKFKIIFNGNGQGQPGLIDAFFDLDR